MKDLLPVGEGVTYFDGFDILVDDGNPVIEHVLLRAGEGDEVVAYSNVVEPGDVVAGVYIWTEEICPEAVVLDRHFLQGQDVENDSHDDDYPVN